jgi:16S rRNA G1207 methylase RsmC
VDGLSAHSDVALDRCHYPHGPRVLDIGCGFGDSKLQIAGQVGPTGEAVDMDCAENFIHAAENNARKNGVNNARFFIGDTVTHLPGHDAVESLIEKSAAALSPGGTLVLSLRDYTVPLTGDQRFIPVRSGDERHGSPGRAARLSAGQPPCR